MRKIFIAAIAIFTIAAAIAAADTAGYTELLKKVDKLVTFQESDLSAEYTIVKRDPGGSTSTTVAAMFRRDRSDQF
jgi:hypothetical protein